MALILVCGCTTSKADDIVPILKGFACDFSVDGSDLGGELSVNSEGDVTFLFVSPSNINGTSIRVKEESIILEVHGISERYLRSSVPNSAPTLYIYDSLNSAASIKPRIFDDSILIDGTSESGKYTLYLGGTGFIERIALHGTGTFFNLSNHSLREI